MGFELPNGKTARNLQDQVKFLSEKLKDLYAAFNDSGLKKIVIVEELPEVGDPTVLYLLAKEDPEEGDYYDEYLWYDNQWELIGSTQIDLSDYCTLSTDQTITGTKTIGDGSAAATPYLSFKNSYYTGGLRLSGYGFQFNTGLQLEGNLTPYPNNSLDIGNSTYTWKDLYLSGNLDLNNNVKINSNAYSGLQVQINGNNIFTVYTGYTLLNNTWPAVNNAYDLGSNDNKWRDLYLSGTANINYHSIVSDNIWLTLKRQNVSIIQFYDSIVQPYTNNSVDLGTSSKRWKDLYLSGNVSDGTWSATVEALVKKSHLYTHNITCSNGTLVLIGSFSASITSQSSLSMAEASALKMVWNNNTVLQIVNGTSIYYFDTSDSTIKTATIGTFTSDTITDY